MSTCSPCGLRGAVYQHASYLKLYLTLCGTKCLCHSLYLTSQGTVLLTFVFVLLAIVSCLTMTALQMASTDKLLLRVACASSVFCHRSPAHCFITQPFTVRLLQKPAHVYKLFSQQRILHWQ